MKKLLLSVLALAAISAKAETGWAEQDQNAPFGWATCSSLTSGNDYTVTGGAQGQTITLTSTGEDMKNDILNAIKGNDVIIFDGSAGDFIVSSYIKLSGLKDKTLVGINGARLCTQWYVTEDITKLLDEKKVYSASTSSGTGGTLSNGTEVGEEAEYLTRQILIDYTGDAKESYRNSGIFYVSKCSNFIVRNLQFVGPGSIDVGGYDLLSVLDGTTHFWVDHCDFTDGIDGNFDITKTADFGTVSWCTFSYTDRSYMHQNTNLVGSSDSYTADEDKLNITFAFNVWGQKCRARMPMARFGTIHMLNNYFNCKGNATACINPRKNSEFLIEGNYFEQGVTKIFSQSGAKAYVWADSNITVEKFNPTSQGEVSMPYTYQVVDAALLPELLTGAQGAGATLQDPLNISDATSSIKSVSGRMDADVEIYDICGNRVKDMSRPGIYISGGRKIVVR